MVSLPGLDQYTNDELELARLLSPALVRYERLLSSLPLEDIHRVRHDAWIKCVLATYFKRASTADICLYWSEIADIILKRVWQECGLDQFETVLFALGKHGAMELNLSSDIDVLIVAEPQDTLAIEKGLRRFQQRLQVPVESGFCFRLDFDLRPGGKMGPLITSPAQFQDYYWSQGETWERLALVRLRAVVGSLNLQQSIGDLAKRFSFRKFLDFTLLDDLKALRSQVHQKGFVRREGELHLKLEVGGIRDIELFVHSLLVLNGGKIIELQTRSTAYALELLKQKNLLPASEADFLSMTYWEYRDCENIVQSIDDRQTHSLVTHKPPVPGLLTATDIEKRMAQVNRIVSTLLGALDLEAIRLPADEPAQIAWLKALGFSDEAITTSWDPLIKATALSHKNDRDERARQEFLYSFVTEIARNSGLDRDLGLSLLNDFVRATRAKATFFAMLLRSPRLIEDLARLFCLSPYLGSIVASRPELLDHFILQLDENWSEEIEVVLQQMSERKLLTELWSANQYLTDKNLQAMFTRISEMADSICQRLLVQLKREFPDSQIEIIALGKWGGGELGLRSDLDFIFVTPGTPNESDFKVARRFIARLTDPSKAGSLYDLDLRLRPSGQSGALLVAVDKLFDYWQNSAAAWERQAYLRARSLSPILKLNKQLLLDKGLSAGDLVELKDIRSKLFRKPDPDQIDIKYTPGGLLDIEFVAQTALLDLHVSCAATSTLGMIETLAAIDERWKKHAQELRQAYSRLREFEQTLQLSSTHKTGEAKRQSPMFVKAAGLMGRSAEQAWLELQTCLGDSRRSLNELDPTGLKI